MAWEKSLGTFGERTAELERRVGTGRLTGTVERNQAYAKYQHENLTLAHPHGGQGKYQEAALMAGHRRYLARVAGRVLDGGIELAMAQAMEQLDDDSARLCPKETTVLARSGAPVVRSAGRVVYRRPPQVPRLSDAELRAIHARGVRVAGR